MNLMETNFFPNTYLGVLITAVMTVAYFLNLIWIKKNQGKGQKIFSWILWTVLDSILLLVSEQNESHFTFLVLVNLVGSFATTFFLMKYKNWDWGLNENIVLFIISIFSFFWWASTSILLGLAMAVIAQLIAGWPLFKESWLKPQTGLMLISYILFNIGYLLMIIDSPDWKIENVIFPVAFFMYTIGDTFPLLRKWGKEDYPILKNKIRSNHFKTMVALSILLILYKKKNW